MKIQKNTFIIGFTSAIVVFFIAFILDIVLLYTIAQRFYFSSNWPIYVAPVLDILICLGVIMSSALFLIIEKRQEKYGYDLMMFLSVYVTIFGAAGFLTNSMYAIRLNSISAIANIIISVIQLAFGIGCIVLTKKSPKEAKIFLIIAFSLFALSKLLDFIFVIIDNGLILSLFIDVLAIAFDGIILPILIKIKKDETLIFTVKEENITKDNLPNINSQGENINLLLKYNDLLEKGIITKEEFDIKKKELLR